MELIAKTCPRCGTSFEGRASKTYCSRKCQTKKAQPLRDVVHIVIPDTQVKPGVPIDHLAWLGYWLADRYSARQNLTLRIIMIGDWYDMQSLSSYDKGKRQMEGRRVRADLQAGRDAWELLDDTMRNSGDGDWSGVDLDLRYLLGNHEWRVQRAIDLDAQLDGLISMDDLWAPEGWQRHGFLEIVELDGVAYSHYFANRMTGRPLSGQSMDARIKTVGRSFTMGHQQGLWMGRRELVTSAHLGLVAGSFYLHDEDYLGPQGNRHWRGFVACHNVEDGEYDPMPVSLNYLCRRYEGVRLRDFTPRVIL